MTQLNQGFSQAQQGATSQQFTPLASLTPAPYGITQPSNFQAKVMPGPYEPLSSYAQSPAQQGATVGGIYSLPNGHESRNGTDATAMHAQDLLPHGSLLSERPMSFGSNTSAVQSLPVPQASPHGPCCSSLLLAGDQLPATSIHPIVSPPSSLSQHTNSSQNQNLAVMGGINPGDFGDPMMNEHCKKEDHNFQNLRDSVLDGAQTTLFSIPSFLATSDNPITPQQQSLLDQNHTYHPQNVPMHSQSGVMGLAAPSADSEGIFSHTDHACNCGPGCRCLYCPVHPFNEETKRHTQEIADLMPYADSASSLSSPPQSAYDSSFVNSELTPIPTNGDGNHLNEFVSPMSQVYPNQPPMPQSMFPPSLPEEGNLHSMVSATMNGRVDEAPSYPRRDSEYYHYTYAVGPARPDCTAVPGTCACGDNCSCLGCLTHTGHTGEQ